MNSAMEAFKGMLLMMIAIAVGGGAMGVVCILVLWFAKYMGVDA